MPSYWQRYSFERPEDEDIVSSFNRLAISRQWAQGSRTYRTEYAECVGAAFKERFGSDGTKLAGWQALCKDAGMSDVPPSIRQCRLVGTLSFQVRLIRLVMQALSRVYINIVDLTQARATGKPVTKFKSAGALRDYILKTRKIFPKEAAKKNGFLKALLITVFR